MSRTHQNKSTVFNNYVVIPLIARRAAPISQASYELASLPMPARFRISEVQFVAHGITATVIPFISSGTAGLNVVTGVSLVNGTPQRYTTNQLSQLSEPPGPPNREIPKGDTLKLSVFTDGTGLSTTGALMAYVIGYFMEPISKMARFMESGQCASPRPVSGYYCNIPMQNLRAQTGAVASRVECSFIAPFPCRVQAIMWNALGYDGTGAGITSTLYNATDAAVIAILDIDVNPNYCLDKDSATTFISDAVRDIDQGDQIDLYMGTEALDIVPLGALSADILVWVKGHVNTDPTVED